MWLLWPPAVVLLLLISEQISCCGPVNLSTAALSLPCQCVCARACLCSQDIHSCICVCMHHGHVRLVCVDCVLVCVTKAVWSQQPG